MKNIYIIIIVIAGVFSSCSDEDLLLKNPNNIDSTQFYQTEEDLIASVTGVYADLRSFPGIFNLYLSEVRSNNIGFDASSAQRDPVDISRFNVTETLNTLEDAWGLGYRIVARANKVLEVINTLNLPNEALNKRSEGEVRFLRAYSNYCLMRTFGRIPLINAVISPDDGLEIGQSELPEIYEAIELDLKIAIESLADSYPNGIGRVTKKAAQALLAEVYLNWSGYPLEELSKVDQAIPLLESLIRAGLDWSNDFSELFKVANNNTYALFEIQYISGVAGIGAEFPTEFLNANMLEALYGAVPQLRPSNDIYRVFDMENDERYNATLDTIYTNNFYIPTEDNYIKKWFESGITLLNRSDWPHNFPIIRPANVYLMHAEALYLKNKEATSEAIQSLNVTRQRAGLAYYTPASRDAFFNELNNEYRREFVGEGVYWHFLVRSGKAVEVMNNWFVNIPETITINANKLIYPIPFSQMQIKQGLYKQNEGY